MKQCRCADDYYKLFQISDIIMVDISLEYMYVDAYKIKCSDDSCSGRK